MYILDWRNAAMPAAQSPRSPRSAAVKRAPDAVRRQALVGGDAAAATPISAARRSKLLTRVAAFYHRTLMEAPEELARLKQAFGVRDTSLFKTFQVGLANGSLLDVLPTDAQSVAELKALGVLTADGAEYFRGCIVFPLVNTDGVVVNLCGRRQNARQGDELYLSGERQGLWNPNACRRSTDLVLTESVLDAFIALDHGITQSMPCPGVTGLSEEQLAHLAHCGVARIALVAGGTEPGRAGMQTVAAQLRERSTAVASIVLPDGESLHSYLTGTHADDAARAFQVKVGEAFASLAAGEGSAERLRVAVPGELYQRTPHGFRLALHGRAYEVKGIARERTQLKVTIKASGEPAKGFELTTLDLYSSRSRETYVKACMTLFGETEPSIKADIARVIECAEAWAPEEVIHDAPAPSSEDEARATAFLANPDLFAEIVADLETLGVAGEETNKLLCYLACVSRKLDDPLSLIIQSRSAAGKSTLQHAILSLCPEEDQVHYTRLTSQALYYQEETRLAHKVLALEETRGLGEAAYSLRALQSAKKLTVATTAKDPLSGRMKTEHYSVRGPVAVLLTTTSAVLDEETASRFLTITIDESEAMTETILASQRQRDTLAGHLAELDRQTVIAKHHIAQRLLEPLVVVNPYAEQLNFPAHTLRARRDHQKYLMLIKAIAFLFQKQRPVREAQAQDSRLRYIEVTREDIRRANRIAARVLGASLDELSAPARNLLREIHAMVKHHCAAHGITPRQYVFTRRDVRLATGWSDWQVRTYAKELEALEYLRARRGAWGREYVYELAWEGEDGARQIALAEAETLKDPA
jgi:hypothetical protein